MLVKEKTTIHDVAGRAGVSIATVSRVINNKGQVSETTRQKVMAAVAELGFHYATGAVPAPGKGGTLLMCVSSLTNPFNIAVCAGAQDSARQHGFELLLLETRGRYTTYAQYEPLLRRHSFAGIIFLAPPDPALVSSLNLRCPLIMCSEYFPHETISYVSVDDYAAAKNAVNYLISTGRRNIAMLNGSMEKKYSQNRERGYLDALKEAGLEIRESWVARISSVEYTLARTYAAHMLEQPQRPDAVFCISDVFAAATIKAASKLGLRVPQDLSVIGFDNTDHSYICDPSLTTVKQPSHQIGYQSCELLIEKLRDPGAETRRILLDTELIIRDSTG